LRIGISRESPVRLSVIVMVSGTSLIPPGIRASPPPCRSYGAAGEVRAQRSLPLFDPNVATSIVAPSGPGEADCPAGGRMVRMRVYVVPGCTGISGKATATLAPGASVVVFWTTKGGPPATGWRFACTGTLVATTEPSFFTTAVTDTVQVGGISDTPAGNGGAAGCPATPGTGGRSGRVGWDPASGT